MGSVHEDIALLKAHIKGHYRRDPKTGKRVWVKPHDTKTPAARGKEKPTKKTPATMLYIPKKPVSITTSYGEGRTKPTTKIIRAMLTKAGVIEKGKGHFVSAFPTKFEWDREKFVYSGLLQKYGSEQNVTAALKAGKLHIPVKVIARFEIKEPGRTKGQAGREIYHGRAEISGKFTSADTVSGEQVRILEILGIGEIGNEPRNRP